MIQAQDLRIGNLVANKITGQILPVSHVEIRDCHHYGSNWAWGAIPLSPEILEQWCGFEEIENISYHLKIIKGVKISLINCQSRWLASVSGPFGIVTLRNIHSLHELQNLIHVLTGTEMEVKLPSPLHETENK